MSDPQQPHGLQPSRLFRPWGSKQGYWKGVPLPSDVLIKRGNLDTNIHTGRMLWDQGDTTSQRMTKIAGRPPKPGKEAWQIFHSLQKAATSLTLDLL